MGEHTYDVYRGVTAAEARLGSERMKVEVPEMWLVEGQGPNRTRRDLGAAEFAQLTRGVTPNVEKIGDRMVEHYLVHWTDDHHA